VYLNGLVYVAGATQRIYAFDPVDNLWRTPIKTPYRNFSLAVIQDKLVIVGGESKAWVNQLPYPWFRYHCTNKLFALKLTTNQWQKYNQMRISRMAATAVGYRNMLIITGGCNIINIFHHLLRAIGSTELLNTTTNQWFTCSDLPQPHCNLQPAIVNESLYMLGGVNMDGNSSTVFTTPLDSLLQHQVNWKCIQNSPHCRSAVAAVSGNLIVLGGRKNARNSRTCKAYAIDNELHSWKEVSQIPEARSTLSAVSINDTTIVVLGGMKNSLFGGKSTNTVWFGNLNN